MKQILYNLALHNATEFCVAHNIDCAGSHLVKAGRGFSYDLVRDSNGQPIVTITFHKAQVPTFMVHP